MSVLVNVYCMANITKSQDEGIIFLIFKRTDILLNMILYSFKEKVTVPFLFEVVSQTCTFDHLFGQF